MLELPTNRTGLGGCGWVRSRNSNARTSGSNESVMGEEPLQPIDIARVLARRKKMPDEVVTPTL
jgi:hypothetical protein